MGFLTNFYPLTNLFKNEEIETIKNNYLEKNIEPNDFELFYQNIYTKIFKKIKKMKK